MKVLLINGSPHREGNTFIALSEVARTLESEGVQAEIVHIGTKAVQGCIACGKCAELGHCVFSDALYTTVREKLADAAPAGLIGPTQLRLDGDAPTEERLMSDAFYAAHRSAAGDWALLAEGVRVLFGRRAWRQAG